MEGMGMTYNIVAKQECGIEGYSTTSTKGEEESPLHH
jgi:hypothetical protein